MLNITTADYYQEQDSAYIKGQHIVDPEAGESLKDYRKRIDYDFSIKIIKDTTFDHFIITVATLDQDCNYIAKQLPLIRNIFSEYAIKTRRKYIETSDSIYHFATLLSDQLFEIWTQQLIDTIMKYGKEA